MENPSPETGHGTVLLSDSDRQGMLYLKVGWLCGSWWKAHHAAAKVPRNIPGTISPSVACGLFVSMPFQMALGKSDCDRSLEKTMYMTCVKAKANLSR